MSDVSVRHKRQYSMETVIKSTEEQILTAAFDVLIEKGLGDTKMQDIADRAGIKRTVLNYYFRTKEKLCQRVAGDILRQGMPEMVRILNGDLPLFEKIESFTERYIVRLESNPFMALFLVNEINEQESSFLQSVAEQVAPNIDGFTAHVEREIAFGNIVPVHPVQLYMNIISLCVFPMMAKPLLKVFTRTSEEDMNRLLEDRKKEVARMLIKLITP